MSDTEEIIRIPTFIMGFDQEMEGGIPKDSIVLVTGAPGTMKSSIAFSCLYWNAIRYGRKGIYFTLEQSRDNLLQHINHLGLDFSKVKRHISIVDLGFIRKNSPLAETDAPLLEIFKTYAQNLKSSMDFDLLVMDSLPVLNLMTDLFKERRALFELLEWLRELEVTSFLISESPPEREEVNPEDFLADGIIHVKMARVQDVNIQRRIRIEKMRATRHSPHYFTLLFQDGEFQATRIIIDG